MFNYSIPKQKQVTLTSILRATYPIYNKIVLGAEVNYFQFFGKYGNNDNLGGIAFARINPYQGFIGEIGYSYNSMISSTRQSLANTKGIFAAVGYQVKINKLFSIEFQYRALPMKYLENGVVNSKIYLLGFNFAL